MGHLNAKNHYMNLRERLDKNSIGAPDTKAVFDVLSIIFTEEEARIASMMPMKFTSVYGIAKRVGMTPQDLQPILDRMADKGQMYDFTFGDKMLYMLPPTIVGLFEFSMMRARQDFDQKKLANALHEVLVGDPAFISSIKDIKSFPLRVTAHESSMDPSSFTQVLDYERASVMLENAGDWAVSLCHCRHVMQHKGEDCQKFGMDTCLSIGMAPDWIVRHNLGRRIGKNEAMDLLAASQEAGLVNMLDNVRKNPSFMCNCCGCCCGVLAGYKKFKDFEPIFSSNFIATIDNEACNGCGKCAKACPIDIIDLVPSERVINGKKVKKLAVIDQAACIGCGVCHAKCKFESLKMKSRPVRRVTPETMFKRILMAALEQGNLQNLLIEDTDGMGWKAANNLLGAILNLPPAKRYLLKDTVRSRFIDFIVDGAKKAGIKGADL